MTAKRTKEVSTDGDTHIINHSRVSDSVSLMGMMFLVNLPHQFLLPHEFGHYCGFLSLFTTNVFQTKLSSVNFFINFSLIMWGEMLEQKHACHYQLAYTLKGNAYEHVYFCHDK